MSEDQNEPGDNAPDLAAVSREAASRRRELRAEQAAKAEVEAERDALRARLNAADEREVKHLAAKSLRDPADLFLAKSIDEMRGDDGHVDFEKAQAAIDEVIDSKPHWRLDSEMKMPDLHLGARPIPARKPSFGEALKRGR